MGYNLNNIYETVREPRTHALPPILEETDEESAQERKIFVI